MISSNSSHHMKSSLGSSGILENFFKDFYYELLACKELALRTGPLDIALEEALPKEEEEPPEKTPEDESEEAEPSSEKSESEENLEKKDEEPGSANSNKHLLSAFPKDEEISINALKTVYDIQERLKKKLAEQTEKVLHLLDQTDTLQFKEAQYAMVALADEVFLTLPWNGRQAWQKMLLEGQIFQSQSAGSQIFERMDSLLSKYDPSRIEGAKIYFLILSLGFKGYLNEVENKNVLKHYERKLYVFIFGKNPSLEEYSSKKLISNCYDHTMLSSLSRRLPGVRFWTRVIIAVLAAYLLLSGALWYHIASDLYEALDSIFDRFQHFLSNDVG